MQVASTYCSHESTMVHLACGEAVFPHTALIHPSCIGTCAAITLHFALLVVPLFCTLCNTTKQATFRRRKADLYCPRQLRLATAQLAHSAASTTRDCCMHLSNRAVVFRSASRRHAP